MDEQVYGTTDKVLKGLRMVHASKASKCHECRTRPTRARAARRASSRATSTSRATTCCTAYRGTRVDDEVTAVLKNPAKLYEYTTVRSAATTTTAGWAAYDGCPAVPELRAVAGKRKRASPASASSRVRDAACVRVATNYLRRFCAPHYENASVQLLADGKGYIARVAATARTSAATSAARTTARPST